MKVHTDEAADDTDGSSVCNKPCNHFEQLSYHIKTDDDEVLLEFNVDVANDSKEYIPEYDSSLPVAVPTRVDGQGESVQTSSWSDGQLSISHSSDEPFIMKIKTEEDI